MPAWPLDLHRQLELVNDKRLFWLCALGEGTQRTDTGSGSLRRGVFRMTIHCDRSLDQGPLTCVSYCEGGPGRCLPWRLVG